MRRAIIPETSRTGFTLLEVIIALSLTLLLLTAVYGAVRLQYRLSTSGREQMERAQIVRAVLRQIEADVRSVTWQVQKTTPTSDETSTDDSSTGAIDDISSDESSEFLSTDDALVNGTSGIFGDAQSLVLHVNRPSRSLVYAASIDEELAAAERSDRCSISYFMADPTTDGLSADVAQANGGGSSVLGGVVGLARLEEDRQSMEQSADVDTTDSLSGSTKLLAEEVVAIEFAYWDGLEWLDTWDSAISGTLPSAIGVTLSIDTETSAADRTLARQMQQSIQSGAPTPTGDPVQVRYVIAVPLAEPYVSEASF